MKPIETERLLLRKFTEADFPAVHGYASAAENIIYMPWGPNSEEETRAFIRMAIREADAVPCQNRQYAVVHKESGALIGGCDLALRREGEGSLGWILHRDHWRRGYGTEIGEALLRLAFEKLGLHRVIATCDADNAASYGVMEKIGMRREGLFLEARPASKGSAKPYGDELWYAILKDEWHVRRENDYYNDLPCMFDGFIELPELSDGVLRLVCTAKQPANPEKKWVPAYEFAVCLGGEKIGDINLRIGYGGGPHDSNLYYSGQIGYNISEPYRGNGYAGRACRLLTPVARAHHMEKLLITNDESNTASRRVCEKLGLHHVRTARVPQWHDLYTDSGYRYVKIYEWSVK
jgi:RimJ/RimL family protein N-acetyltransferase